MDSSKWAVRFSFTTKGAAHDNAMPNQTRQASDPSCNREPAAFLNPICIAARLEAVRRVLEAPEKYATRLAHQLRARTEACIAAGDDPQPLVSFIERILARHVHNYLGVGWLLHDLQQPAIEAAMRFVPSG